ncbi:pectate lyase [Marinilabilia sp.]|uniref:pectate lyase family protein n=1 Tax=Marinilabilia sp. TaxID=2021252 RepID=UPI0025B89F93|nr:pectate lyase [Marinilabilia sp.]
MMQRFKIVATILILMFSGWACSQGQNDQQVLAFPGALGAGKYTTGGRGGEIVLVTNLNDEGPGSLRKAVRKHGARIVIFKVSGNIELKSPLDINNGDITIAGQTAPGQGICLTGYPLKVKADNVIVRYVRVRPGDISGGEVDAFTCKDNRNVIVDHCSFSWGNDEVCSVYDNENSTVQWCIISESMNKSDHHKGEHGYGGIWGGKTASFIGNLMVHHISRNPRLQGSRYHKQPEKERAELVNNVVYNWGSKCMYAGEDGNYNMVNNYFKPGPATSNSASEEFLEPYKPFSNYYISGNVMHGNSEITGNNALGLDIDDYPVDSILVSEPHVISDYAPLSAEVAFEEVVKHAGASLKRDAVDSRIMEEVQNGSFTYGENGIINSQSDVGGWPDLESAEYPRDSDNDGIPDAWEKSNELDSNNPEDAAVMSISDDYANIEVWFNSLVE